MSVKPPSQGKTKAKQRYLRRKKERRKTKTKTQPRPEKIAKTEVEDQDSDSDEINVDVGTTSDSEEIPEQVVEVNIPTQKRPKKRRKTGDGEPIEVDPEGPREPSPPTKPSLPSFPLPSLPNPPLKSDLALQGLDKALVNAEIIDYRTTKPIPAEGDDDGGTGLSERARKRLAELGITELFAVQTALLPFLIPTIKRKRALYLPYDPPQDVCVSAPTGSGKTLAYVLPIIEILSTRLVTRLRALIVLPTRDLVAQVRETFEALIKGHNLKIGTATGQHSFAHEQSQLIADRTTHLVGGSSKIDILICTPGRLMDHINETPNFSLQHLRFLVIDEADRLLTQSFQDWLAQVLTATRSSLYLPTLPPADFENFGHSEAETGQHHPDALAPHLLPSDLTQSLALHPKHPTCQKLLFSATLTRDPGKIAKLDLRDVKYFVVQNASVNGHENEEKKGGALVGMLDGYTMPSNLTEHMIICTATQKPLILFHLIHSQRIRHALVFTKSAESTERLVKLFDLFEGARLSSGTGDGAGEKVIMRAYSSDLSTAERKSILDQFKTEKIQVLIASDLISRGIDIPLTHTISYDVPLDITKYIHRAGRTARAGREGSTWTLVEEQEARWFKGMLREADGGGTEDAKVSGKGKDKVSRGWLERVKRVRVGEVELKGLEGFYEIALGKLKEVYVRQ